MSRTNLLQEIRKMRFEEASGGWQAGRLRQEEATWLLEVCERTFRRYVGCYEDEGLQGLIDKRLEQVSHWRAPVDEVNGAGGALPSTTGGLERQAFPRLLPTQRGQSAATPGSRTSCKRPVWYRRHLGEASTASGAPARLGRA